MERPDMTFRKSSYSGGDTSSCVEVGSAANVVMVRDTKQANRETTVSVSNGAWSRFVSSLR